MIISIIAFGEWGDHFCFTCAPSSCMSRIHVDKIVKSSQSICDNPKVTLLKLSIPHLLSQGDDLLNEALTFPGESLEL